MVNGLEITDIKIKKLTNLGRLLGEVSITINNCLVIHNIKLIQLEDKRMAGFPQTTLPSGNRVDVVHPITKEFREYVEDYIFSIYDKDGVQE